MRSAAASFRHAPWHCLQPSGQKLPYAPSLSKPDDGKGSVLRDQGHRMSCMALAQMFRRGDLAAEESSAAWSACAQVQQQDRDFAGASETATAGLRWLAGSSKGSEAGGGQQSREEKDVVTQLRTILANCLLDQGQLEQASFALGLIAGAASAFILCPPQPGSGACDSRRSMLFVAASCMRGHRCGVNIRILGPRLAAAGNADTKPRWKQTPLQRQALRGLARAAALRGNTEAAERLYERILGKAARLSGHRQAQQERAAASAISAFEHLLGGGEPNGAAEEEPDQAPATAEHWAHGDYGWLLHEQGRHEVGLEPYLTAVAELHLLFGTYLSVGG